MKLKKKSKSRLPRKKKKAIKKELNRVSFTFVSYEWSVSQWKRKRPSQSADRYIY